MPAFAFLSDAESKALVAHILGDAEPESDAGAAVAAGRPYTHMGYNRFLDPDGYPAVKPPWGTLNAIDLDAGEIRWTVTLGELPELTARGLPPTGTENYGGPVVTAGGLLFIGATKDEKFRAFDKRTGKVLWETTLPAGGYATPATYEASGKQYVVIAAGGGKMGTKSGDAYVAFALPD
jgi:quinoprotein glucose dehydrogenase